MDQPLDVRHEQRRPHVADIRQGPTSYEQMAGNQLSPQSFHSLIRNDAVKSNRNAVEVCLQVIYSARHNILIRIMQPFDRLSQKAFDSPYAMGMSLAQPLPFGGSSSTLPSIVNTMQWQPDSVVSIGMEPDELFQAARQMVSLNDPISTTNMGMGPNVPFATAHQTVPRSNPITGKEAGAPFTPASGSFDSIPTYINPIQFTNLADLAHQAPVWGYIARMATTLFIMSSLDTVGWASKEQAFIMAWSSLMMAEGFYRDSIRFNSYVSQMPEVGSNSEIPLPEAGECIASFQKEKYNIPWKVFSRLIPGWSNLSSEVWWIGGNRYIA